MERLFVDTSAWYSYANGTDPDHEAVAASLEPWVGRLMLTDYVFDELVTLVRMRVGHANAVKIGRALRFGHIAVLAEVEPRDIGAAWQQFQREGDKEYSFTDCTSFALMRRLGLKRAAALDDDFRQAGFIVVP